jgi:hypothetical protein
MLAVVSSRILSRAECCLLTLAERMMRERLGGGCSDMGNVTCGFGSERPIIEDSHDLVRRLSFGKKLGDQRVRGMELG